MRDDASIHHPHRGRDLCVRQRAGKVDADAERLRLGFEGGLQRAFADEDEDWTEANSGAASASMTKSSRCHSTSQPTKQSWKDGRLKSE